MVAENEVLKEFASRELSRRHLLPFIQRCHPGYMAGWVHHELCERLEVFAADVIANKSPRLMVMMPPRLGKSLIASQYFPAWFLGRFPDKEIISCSYALSLQLSFSKKVRSLLSSEAFSAVFPQAQLSEDMQSAEGWRTTANGGFKPAGRGGPINGFGCLAGGTLVQTASHGLVPVATLVRLWPCIPIEVLGFDHITGEVKPCKVLAVKITENQEVIRVHTAAGRHIRLTADHRVYVQGRGYTEAGLLEPGDGLVVLNTGIGVDAVTQVDAVCDRGIPVYDLQVEGTSNLFANEILVHNCHILVIDDLIKNATEAYSDSTRSSAWEWYTSTARTRLAPGGGILTIGTRWHHDDPMGRMEDGEGDVFDVIRYPAIATHDEPHRKRGEALHPERYDVKELRKIQSAVGPAVWEALYQQNPTPDVGGYFEDSWFRYYTGTPEDLRTFMAWDLAIGKKERNDWTVGVIGGVDQVGNLYILDMIRAKLDSLAIVDTIISMHEKYETFLCGIERGQLSMAILPMLNARIADHGAYSLAIKEMAPGRQDKESRARSLQGRLRQGKVFLPQDAEWLADLKGEFLQFPNSRHDDIVDSCAYLGLLMDEIPPVRTVEPTVEPEWLKRILKTFANPTFMGA